MSSGVIVEGEDVCDDCGCTRCECSEEDEE